MGRGERQGGRQTEKQEEPEEGPTDRHFKEVHITWRQVMSMPRQAGHHAGANSV